MKKNIISCLVISAAIVMPFTISGIANAASQLNGLTVAVSESGKKLVAGGDTRTILEINPKTLAVKKRHWIGTSIVRMAFNKSGSILAVQDASNTVLLYDTKTWRAKYTLRKYDMMTVLARANLLAGVDNAYRGATIHVNSLKDGANLVQINLDNRERVAALGFSKDGKKIAVLTRAKKSNEEKKVQYRDIPKDLRGLARDDFIQRNDGNMSVLRVYAVPSGKKISETKTFYSPGSEGRIIFDKDGLVAVSRNRLGARFFPDGKANVFQTKNSYNYGIGISPDQSLWLTGGRAFALTSNPGLATKGTGRLPNLPGRSEYFKGFSATRNNKAIYGGTSAYRIVKIDNTGKIVKVEPAR